VPGEMWGKTQEASDDLLPTPHSTLDRRQRTRNSISATRGLLVGTPKSKIGSILINKQQPKMIVQTHRVSHKAFSDNKDAIKTHFLVPQKLTK